MKTDSRVALLRSMLRIRRVEEIADGSKLARDQDWITPQAYFRERRGGRHLGVDDMYFGAAARDRQLRDGEAKLRDIEERLRAVVRVQSMLDHAFLTREVSTDFEAESVAERLVRRAKTWIGTVNVSPPLS